MEFSKDIPAPTPKDYVTAQHGFQYLVSYTDSGFVPSTISVNKGETIRFTNNASGTLRISLAGSLARGAYLEYTFTKSGTVSDRGTNRVQIIVN